jgi:hypothetical protein
MMSDIFAQSVTSPTESHMLVASSESLFLWDLEAGELVQQADAPGTSGSTMPAGERGVGLGVGGGSLQVIVGGLGCREAGTSPVQYSAVQFVAYGLHT